MTTPTVDIVKERLEAILGELVTAGTLATVITEEHARLSPESLPAIEVKPGDGTWTRDTFDFLIESRVYELWLFVAKITQPDAAEELKVMRQCHPYLSVIPRHFLDRSRLALNGGDLDGVDSATLPSDSGPGKSPFYDSEMYAVVRYRMTIVTS